MKKSNKKRISIVTRNTNETKINVKVELDGKGNNSISTGLPFFDHMLEQLSKHSLINIELSCVGDLKVDAHHTMEDCGLALGKAIKEALGDKKGIKTDKRKIPNKNINAESDNLLGKKLRTALFILVMDSGINNSIKKIYNKINDYIDQAIKKGNDNY